MLNKLLKDQFPKGAFYQHGAKEIDTLSERRIRQMCWCIRSKPDWLRKLDDPEIGSKWEREAKEQGLTDREIAYVVKELQYYKTLCGGSQVVLSAVEQVWQSDTLIDAETLKELKDYVKTMESVPDRHKDWHPNSNQQVLNLIHPSLYPIAYGQTPILPEPIPSPEAALAIRNFGTFHCKLEEWDIYQKYKAKETDRGTEHSASEFLSFSFCWLPTEFMVSEDGSVTIDSYINNLHPIKHAKLYPIIANVFAKFVPLLEQVVTDIVHPRSKRVVPDYKNWYEYDGPEPELPENQGYESMKEYETRYDEWEETQRFVEPQPNEFVMPERPHLPYSLKGRHLQAIVKLSNIQLTPEKPEYEGGSWHVEAMANERIIATGIYYYDVENITESKLTFREQLEQFWGYENSDYDGAEMAYGVRNNELKSQEIGHVVVEQGRCLVFPNIYQHKVSGFKLKDLTKPGHRKILAFFFIDPSTTIPSTEYVPPQQQDWWAEQFIHSNDNSLAMLPDLVKDNILKYVKFPISLKDAKDLRLELMEERTFEVDEGIGEMFEPQISLCEH